MFILYKLASLPDLYHYLISNFFQDSEFAVHNYYPGQQFRGSLGDLESAQWIKTTSSYSPGAARLKQNKEITVTVTKVRELTLCSQAPDSI